MGELVELQSFRLKRIAEQDLIAFAKQGAPSDRHEVADSVLYESSLGWIAEVDPA